LRHSEQGFTGGSIAVSDVDNDGIDDIILGAPDDGGYGAVYIVKGRSNFAADTDLGILINDVTVVFAAAATTLGTTVSALGDVNGDSVDDIALSTADGDVYIIDGTRLQGQDTLSLTAADVTLTGVSGSVTSTGTTDIGRGDSRRRLRDHGHRGCTGCAR